MQVDARSCMNVFGTSDTSIIDDSCCGVSDVTFRTVPPIGGLSCFNLLSHAIVSYIDVQVWNSVKRLLIFSLSSCDLI